MAQYHAWTVSTGPSIEHLKEVQACRRNQDQVWGISMPSRYRHALEPTYNHANSQRTLTLECYVHRRMSLRQFCVCPPLKYSAPIDVFVACLLIKGSGLWSWILYGRELGLSVRTNDGTAAGLMSKLHPRVGPLSWPNGFSARGGSLAVTSNPISQHGIADCCRKRRGRRLEFSSQYCLCMIDQFLAMRLVQCLVCFEACHHNLWG